MSQIKKIMVALDLTSMDDVIFKYLKTLSTILQPENIYCIHVEENLDLPDEIKNELDIPTDMPSDEGFREKLNEEIAEKLTPYTNASIENIIVEGSPMETILHWAQIKDIDLLVVGKKNISKGTGILPQKLTRKIDAHVLFVPENHTKDNIKRVLLPIDFSKNSKRAADMVNDIFRLYPHMSFIGVNCFTLPMGWQKSGKTKEEFEEIMERNAVNKFSMFTETIEDGDDFKGIFKIDLNNEPSEEIMEAAHEENVDLIVIGARGKTDMAAIILGSTTEKLIQEDNDIPLMVVKTKGETLGFLDAIFKMK